MTLTVPATKWRWPFGQDTIICGRHKTGPDLTAIYTFPACRRHNYIVVLNERFRSSEFWLSAVPREDVPLVECVYARMPGEKSYRRRLSSLLLRLCDVFRALINSLVC